MFWLGQVRRTAKPCSFQMGSSVAPQRCAKAATNGKPKPLPEILWTPIPRSKLCSSRGQDSWVGPEPLSLTSSQFLLV